MQKLHLLADLIERDREPLLARWRSQVKELPSARNLDVPTLNDHIPSLLAELAVALRANSGETIPEALRDGSSPAHGIQRVRDDFDIAEVVAEYNILRDCLHDLADSNGLNLQGEGFHVINRVMDSAIGIAVQAFATQRAIEVQRRRDEYLAFVAHDLRTPLNAISLVTGFLEMTFPERNVSPETAQMFQSLRRNVKQLSGLVTKVLHENANIQPDLGLKLTRRSFDLWPLIESLIYDIKPLADTAGAKILNRVPSDLVVYADADAMNRVFQNLVENAIRYTPQGQITIAAMQISTAGDVECSVADNGAGIDNDALQRVFDKGESDPGHQDGTGLGLAIVKSFVEAHDGKVSVESEPKAGTKFRIWLPGPR